MKNLFVILTLITFAVSFAYGANEPEDSLILYFSFDELDGENTIDHSKYENHGEMVGAPNMLRANLVTLWNLTVKATGLWSHMRTSSALMKASP